MITPTASNYSPAAGQQDRGSSHGYLSAVLNSAKQKAAGLRWPNGEPFTSSTAPLPPSVDSSAISTDTEPDELPVSSSLIDENNDLASSVDEKIDNPDVSSLLESFDKFRFDREAKLEEWLQAQEASD